MNARDNVLHLKMNALEEKPFEEGLLQFSIAVAFKCLFIGHKIFMNENYD